MKLNINKAYLGSNIINKVDDMFTYAYSPSDPDLSAYDLYGRTVEGATGVTLEIAGNTYQSEVSGGWWYMNCPSPTSLSTIAKCFKDTNIKTVEKSNINWTSVKVATALRNIASGNTSLEKISFQGVGKVTGQTDSSSMFKGCSSLSTIDWGNLGYDNVTGLTMSACFADCTSLTSIDLSGLHIISLKAISNMFSGCTCIETINLTGIAYVSATQSNVFTGCSSLEEVITTDYTMFTFVKDRLVTDGVASHTIVDYRGTKYHYANGEWTTST